MFVKAILDEKDQALITVTPINSLHEVAGLFKREQIGFALVKDQEEQMIGTISERDIIHALSKKEDLSGVKVSDVLTVNIVMCDIGDTLEKVREIMTNKRTRHVLVMDAGNLAGVVSIGDLIKHSLDQCKIDTVEMVDYISGNGYH